MKKLTKNEATRILLSIVKESKNQDQAYAKAEKTFVPDQSFTIEGWFAINNMPK